MAGAIAGCAADIVVNIQGDEPMIAPEMIAEVVAPFRSGLGAGIVTLKKEVFPRIRVCRSGVVKVVTDSGVGATSPVP